MILDRINSTNARQPSWQILKDWEKILSEKTGLPIYKDRRVLRYIKSKLNKYGLTKIYKKLFDKKTLGLRFIMGATTKEQCDVNRFTIPVIIDFWLKEKDLKGFYKVYKESPLTLVTNLEVYNFLKKNNCPFPIEHWPLSYPDSSGMITEQLEKIYDFCFIGRPNPFFLRMLDKYCEKHPDFVYIMNNGDINNRQYVDNKGNFIAKDTGRESYMEMIRKTKITCYSTPGVDESKKNANGYNQVTPRVFEMLCNQCHVIGHYPDSADTQWYKLKEIVPNVENYDEFESWMDYYRTTPFNIEKALEYVSRHYTSARVDSLLEILSKHNIELVKR